MMYHKGLHLHLIRRQHMWHLKLNTDKCSMLVLLESSSSTKRRPRMSYVRRRGPWLNLLLEGLNLQWLITISHNSRQIRCQTTVLPYTVCQDI
ncbi:nonstructural protein [Jatobal virus]|uniref:Non-structural protein NS-S n=1 Tax=Jatobal virus TaxID=150058 RepID=A0A023W1Q1_9VIRU|nr:nonstructural protein [Jatobal virus]AHY23684.1 nonstructural protein [Jatobal virus]